MNDIITALYHAASSEEPDTMDGPSLRLLPAQGGDRANPPRPCERCGRRGGRGQLRGSYGVPGLRKRLPAGPGAVYGGVLLWIACWSCLRLAPTAPLICAWTANRRPPPRCSPSWGITRSWRSWSTPTPTRRNRRGSSTAGPGHRLQRGSAWPFGNCLCWWRTTALTGGVGLAGGSCSTTDIPGPTPGLLWWGVGIVPTRRQKRASHVIRFGVGVSIGDPAAECCRALL